MILDRDNSDLGSPREESDGLTELRRLLFETIPEPTEEEYRHMLDQTFSSDGGDLSLLPDPPPGPGLPVHREDPLCGGAA